MYCLANKKPLCLVYQIFNLAIPRFFTRMDSVVKINAAGATRKPNPVPGFKRDRATIIHLRTPVARRLLQPTRKLGRAALKRFSIWSCTWRGLHSFSGRPENWRALTAPFHPCRASLSRRRTLRPPRKKERFGGLLSVALSFASPRLRVTERHALRCSDFPPASSRRSPALLRPYSLYPFVMIFASK